MEVKRFYVMNFKLLRPAAQCARRVKREMLLAHCRPMPRARRTQWMLAFGSIDKMFDYWHGAPKKKPPGGGLVALEILDLQEK